MAAKNVDGELVFAAAVSLGPHGGLAQIRILHSGRGTFFIAYPSMGVTFDKGLDDTFPPRITPECYATDFAPALRSARTEDHILGAFAMKIIPVNDEKPPWMQHPQHFPATWTTTTKTTTTPRHHHHHPTSTPAIRASIDYSRFDHIADSD